MVSEEWRALDGLIRALGGGAVDEGEWPWWWHPTRGGPQSCLACGAVATGWNTANHADDCRAMTAHRVWVEGREESDGR